MMDVMARSRRFGIGVIVMMLAALAPARAQARIDVVASFSILGDFARAVGGARTDVTTPKSGLVTPTGAALLAAFPPRPIASSWPATGMSRSAVLAKVLAAPFTLGNLASQQFAKCAVSGSL